MAQAATDQRQSTPTERALTLKVVKAWGCLLVPSVLLPVALHVVVVLWPELAPFLLMDKDGLTIAGVSLATLGGALFATLGATATVIVAISQHAQRQQQLEAEMASRDSTVRLAISQHEQRQQQLEAEQASRDFVEYREWAKELAAGYVRDAAWAQLAALTDRHSELAPGTIRLAESEISRCLTRSQTAQKAEVESGDDAAVASPNTPTETSGEPESGDGPAARARHAWNVLQHIRVDSAPELKLRGQWWTPFEFRRTTQAREPVILDLSEVDAAYENAWSRIEFAKGSRPPRSLVRPARLVLEPSAGASVSGISTDSELVLDLSDYGGECFEGREITLRRAGFVELRSPTEVIMDIVLQELEGGHGPLVLPRSMTGASLILAVNASGTEVVPIVSELLSSSLELSVRKPDDVSGLTFDVRDLSVLQGSTLTITDRIGPPPQGIIDGSGITDFTAPRIVSGSTMILKLEVDGYWDELVIHNLTSYSQGRSDIPSVRIEIERSGLRRPLTVTLENAVLGDSSIAVLGTEMPSLEVHWVESSTIRRDCKPTIEIKAPGDVSFKVGEQKEHRVTDRLCATYDGHWSVKACL